MTNVPETPERIARCGCGQLTATTQGEPDSVYLCSCSTCQRTSGGSFIYSALFAEANVTVAGERKSWRRTGDSGRWVETSFCPTCGITVAFSCEGFPGVTGIHAGSFADADFVRPAALLWASRRHSWLTLPDDIVPFDTQPG